VPGSGAYPLYRGQLHHLSWGPSAIARNGGAPGDIRPAVVPPPYRILTSGLCGRSMDETRRQSLLYDREAATLKWPLAHTKPGEGQGVRNTTAPVRLTARPSRGLPSDFQPATLVSQCNRLGRGCQTRRVQGFSCPADSLRERRLGRRDLPPLPHPSVCAPSPYPAGQHGPSRATNQKGRG
jgi:hypothetical protein